MISYHHHCIFVRVPKTAGTSIAKALNCVNVGKPHRDILEIKDILESSRSAGELPAANLLSHNWFNEYFKFGFVRNPWSRVVSLYNRGEGVQMSQTMSFDEFVAWINHASDTCIHPSRHKNQLDWFTDRKNNVLVDYIGKFECLSEDWKKISDQFQLKDSLPHKRRNPNNAKHYTEYYTLSTRDIIAKKFQIDIEYFEYTYGD